MSIYSCDECKDAAYRNLIKRVDELRIKLEQDLRLLHNGEIQKAVIQSLLEQLRDL